tara:strand:- start:50 stop:580 length:531 start_codon:yes stop_codon:yes gene_type:complete
MKIYPLLIACSLAITTYTISKEAKAHMQFYKDKESNDNELNINWREIIQINSKNLKSDKNYQESLLVRAFAKGKIKNYRGALKDINKLIKMDSKYNNLAILYRAWFHRSLRNYSEAMDDYSILIENNEYLKDSYSNRGFIKDIFHDQKGACSDWKTGGELGNQNALSAFKNHCANL